MNKPKFTPGPWKAEKPEGSNGWWDVFGKDSVCTCYSLNAGNNANFISAAPKMYECLQKLCFLCGGRSIKSSRECRKCGVKNVLKKARGEK